MVPALRLSMLPALVALIVMACAPATTTPASGTISGTVTYLQRIAIEPSATEIHVQLIDGTEPGSPAVAETKFTPEGQVPIPFSLSYEGSGIVRSHYYYLRAAIIDTASGEVRFATAEDVPVVPGTLNIMELVLEPPGPPAAP